MKAGRSKFASPFSRGVFGEILLPMIVDPAPEETPATRLARILGGDWTNEAEWQIYLAVGERGEGFSLLSPWFANNPPIETPFRTFVPVLARLDADHWKLGLTGHGRLKIYKQANSEKAIVLGLDQIAAWAKEEVRVAGEERK